MPIAAREATVTVGARRRGGATVVTELAGTEPWRPRLLVGGGSVARVALVQTRASLLAGDDVVLDLDLGRDAELELVALGATVAHHARGGSPARLRVRARLGPAARLIWLDEPLIAAAGCHVVRSTSVDLARGAAVLLRDALVLGRAGEQPGRARTRTRVTLEGRPVLDETLDTDPAWLLRSSVMCGGAAMIETLVLAGLRDGAAPPGALQAHEPASLWRDLRALGDAGATACDPVARRWRGLMRP